MVDKKRQVKITERALLQRLNRALLKRYLMVNTCRFDSRWFNELGRFYLVEVNRNAIWRSNVDLEKMGREEGVLKPWEKLGE